MVEITYQMFLSTLQTAGILVGITYYIIIMRASLRNQRMQLEARQLDLYMRRHEQRTKPDWMKNFSEVMQLEWDDFDDFIRKYDHTINPEVASKRIAVWNYYQSLGFLFSRGMIDTDALLEMAGPEAPGIWIKFEPIIKACRKHYGRPEMWNWLEYLMDELKKAREQRGLTEYARARDGVWTFAVSTASSDQRIFGL